MANAKKAERAAVARPGRTCPDCKDGELRRKKHEAWTTWVPLSKFYSCSKCKANFLRLFDSFQVKVKRTGSTSQNRKREFAIVSFAIIMAIYVCYRIVISLYDVAPSQIQ